MNGVENNGIFMPEPTWTYMFGLIAETNPNTIRCLRFMWLIAFPEPEDNGIVRSGEWEHLFRLTERFPYLRKVEFYWYDPVEWFTMRNRRFDMDVDGSEGLMEDPSTINPRDRLRRACDIVRSSLRRLDQKGILSFSDSYGIL
ncbi:hypothetical protein NLI96_g3105 [Meripilus lineatus]|uniref:Uncharacterized protein n=1 Tax=Meripilus lineatus TaxID=2056292 RepID=A0AAD5YJD0_9APHY|nr:hypothetical protein NLI96_g3105 [Physisporinus lineatus]